jgi:hypothetical protein
VTTQPAVDEAKLNEFVGKFAGDLGAVLHAATVLIGDKLGLYKAMADSEPITVGELAERTDTDERYMRKTLKPDGTWMIVEPFTNDRLEDNLNPVGRIFYSASTVICVPASKDQEVGLALGAQAGEIRMREIVTAGRFSRFRRATETPFNLVLEARP